MNSCSVFSTVGKKYEVMKALTRRKSEIIFLRKVFKRNLSIPLPYYLKIGIPLNILKDLREMFNISRNIKYFHFLSGQSLHKFTKFTYRFNQN